MVLDGVRAGHEKSLGSLGEYIFNRLKLQVRLKLGIQQAKMPIV